MSHKIAVVKPGSPYYGTDVSFDRSLMQIQAMLEKHKCTRIMLQKDLRGDPPTCTVLFEKAGLPFIIEFPVIYTVVSSGNRYSPKVKKLKMEISGRIIHDRIKALLIDVELGVQDFEQALMQFLLVRGSDGRPQMLQDFVLERKDQLAQGTFDLTYSLPEGKGV